MPWVRFTADFDFRPSPAVTIAYLKGQVRLVTRACSARAKEARKAEAASKPRSKNA